MYNCFAIISPKISQKLLKVLLKSTKAGKPKLLKKSVLWLERLEGYFKFKGAL